VPVKDRADHGGGQEFAEGDDRRSPRGRGQTYGAPKQEPSVRQPKSPQSDNSAGPKRVPGEFLGKSAAEPCPIVI
jgi:hypothetical protein